jgi:hypothetical protein
VEQDRARLFCHITQTWRGKPLICRQTVVELIAVTTTRTGLTVRCELDTRTYPKGFKVTDAEMATLNIKGDTFNWLQVSGTAEMPQIDEHVSHQLHAVMPLLDEFEPQ